MKEKILSCENLTINYKNHTVVNNLSFSVEKGDFFLVLGKNGIGKSTLLRGILGLKSISFGNIIKNFKTCGYISQEILLRKNFPSTIWEFVLSARAIYSNIFYDAKDMKLVEENLKLLNLWELKDKSINSLSVGQLQRAVICRCLCVSDEIIFLDEPTNSLDISVKEMLYEILEKLNKNGLTIFMISHDKEIFKFANKALLLGNDIRIIENVSDKFEKGEIKFD